MDTYRTPQRQHNMHLQIFEGSTKIHTHPNNQYSVDSTCLFPIVKNTYSIIVSRYGKYVILQFNE